MTKLCYDGLRAGSARLGNVLTDGVTDEINNDPSEQEADKQKYNYADIGVKRSGRRRFGFQSFYHPRPPGPAQITTALNAPDRYPRIDVLTFRTANKQVGLAFLTGMRAGWIYMSALFTGNTGFVFRFIHNDN